jgi:signal transduction histidine kinase
MLMVRAGSSPGGLRSGPVGMWFLPAVVTAAATAIAALVVQSGARAAVIWCGAVATLAVALLAAEIARRGRLLATTRAEHAGREEQLRSRLGLQEAATTNLAQQYLPEAVARLQEGEFAEDVLLSMEDTADGLSAEFQSAHRALLRSVVEAVQAEETLRDSAQRGVVNIARRVQAVVHQQARDLREMEDRHGRRPDVFSDLLKLDHGTALIGRLADSIAVLGGARPGRQWSRPVQLYSVLRGAMSRITDYQRIELHSVVEVAVVGPAVEPLIHALAELLDNATRYSPPKARVHLTASEVHAGVAVEIEDGGVGLSEEARARAEQMLKEAQAGIDLNDLGEAPRLGLAVVGRLAQAYDFQVSLPPSAYGGVRAVLVVPKRLITTAPATTARAHGIGATAPVATGTGGDPREEAVAATGVQPAEADTRDPLSPTAPAAASGDPAAPWSAVAGGPQVGDEVPSALATGAADATLAGEADGHGRMPDQAAAADGGLTAAGHEAVADPAPKGAGGLPQRRRRSPSAAPGGFTQRRPAAPAPAAEEDADAPVPGMWMADLQSGLSGEGRKTSTPRSSRDTTSDKGE